MVYEKLQKSTIIYLYVYLERAESWCGRKSRTYQEERLISARREEAVSSLARDEKESQSSWKIYVLCFEIS